MKTKFLLMFFLCILMLAPLSQASDAASAYRSNWVDDSISYYLNMADKYKYTSNDSIIKYADMASALALKHHLPAQYGFALVSRTYADLLAGDYEKALVNSERANALFIRLRNLRGLMTSYRLTGVVYGNIGDFKVAQDYNYRALRLAEYHKDTALMGNILNNLGIIYYYQKNYEKGMEMLMRVLEMDKGDALNAVKGTTLINIAIIYSEQFNFKKAEEYYIKAIDMAIATHNLSTQGMGLMNLAEMYSVKKDYQRSLNTYFQAVEIFRKYKMKINYATIYLGIAGNYLNLGDEQAAMIYYQMAIDVARSTGTLDKLRKIYGVMKDLLYEKGDYKRAYFYLIEANKLKDSLAGVDAMEKIASLEKKYESERKDNQIARLSIIEKAKQMKIDQQRRQIIILILSAILVIFTLAYLLYQNRLMKSNQRQLVLKNLELMKNEKNRSSESVMAISRLAQIISSEKEILTASVEPEGMDESESLREFPLEEGGKSVDAESMERVKYQKSLLTDPQKQEILNKIIDALETKKMYLDPELSIETFSAALGVYSKYISQVINELLGKNFVMLVNEYRVKEARSIMVDPESYKYTLEAIGQQVGFNSKSSFNTAFKKFTGITPSFFRSTAAPGSER